MNPRSLLTANSESIYSIMWLDTKDGPLVIDAPPHVLGMIDDFWMAYQPMAMPDPDRGEGGKYLLLPPNYTGDVPEGYFVVRSSTFGNLMFFFAATL